jgi:hypothetical protein
MELDSFYRRGRLWASLNTLVVGIVNEAKIVNGEGGGQLIGGCTVVVLLICMGASTSPLSLHRALYSVPFNKAISHDPYMLNVRLSDGYVG